MDGSAVTCPHCGAVFATRAAVTPTASDRITVSSMRALGRKVATGDAKALDELEAAADRLYENIDHDKEKQRVSGNLTLMRSAFNEIGQAAGRGEQPAYGALLDATGRHRLRSFTSDAFGIAAGMGHEPSLEVLLNHDAHGILRSSAVFALGYAAEKNNPRAVDFLIGVIEDDSARALWSGASQGLVASANAGNTRAQAAINKFKTWNESRAKR